MRLLVVMPSWIGDAVMATPALRLLRSRLAGSFIGGLVRPGIDQLLAGTDFFDELHIERAHGVMGPKHVAARLRPRRYDAALLLTNSFSTALITRIAGIPRRIGYDRDARGLLLTDALVPPRSQPGTRLPPQGVLAGLRSRCHTPWAPIPAVAYYHYAARFLLDPSIPRTPDTTLPPNLRLELATTPAEEAAAADLLARAQIPPHQPFAILNPGGNNPAKRWPPDRFAATARHLISTHSLHILISGSPAESDLCEQIRATMTGTAAGQSEISNPQSEIPNPKSAANLASLSPGLGPLKAIIRRAALMITNDTGPRHIAAAFGIPLVSLFGPTDHRWTTIPAPAGEELLLADPTLPPGLLADDHPERCRIDRIPLEDVLAAADRLLIRSR